MKMIPGRDPIVWQANLDLALDGFLDLLFESIQMTEEE